MTVYTVFRDDRFPDFELRYNGSKLTIVFNIPRGHSTIRLIEPGPNADDARDAALAFFKLCGDHTS